MHKSDFVMARLTLFQSLANNAIYGIAIGVSVAFPILVIATRNLVTGFLATLSMASSTVCVIGVITLGGWKLGVSLAFVIVKYMHFSFLIHFAEASIWECAGKD